MQIISSMRYVNTTKYQLIGMEKTIAGYRLNGIMTNDMSIYPCQDIEKTLD